MRQYVVFLEISQFNVFYRRKNMYIVGCKNKCKIHILTHSYLVQCTSFTLQYIFIAFCNVLFHTRLCN